MCRKTHGLSMNIGSLAGWLTEKSSSEHLNALVQSKSYIIHSDKARFLTIYFYLTYCFFCVPFSAKESWSTTAGLCAWGMQIMAPCPCPISPLSLFLLGIVPPLFPRTSSSLTCNNRLNFILITWYISNLEETSLLLLEVADRIKFCTFTKDA